MATTCFSGVNKILLTKHTNMLVTQGFRGYSFSLIVIIVEKTKAIFIETFLRYKKKKLPFFGTASFLF